MQLRHGGLGRGDKGNDISHLQGTNIVASSVCFKNGFPYKQGYRKYSIKTVSGKNKTTGSFWNPELIDNNHKTFDYLIICMLNDDYGLNMILELSWDDFIKYKKFNKRMNNYQVTITKKMIEDVRVVYEKK